MAEGSYFENLTGRSQRLEGTAALYLPPRHWVGQHDLKAGLDLDHIAYNQDQTRAPVSYLRERSERCDRQSVFAPAPPFTLHNAEIGAYLQDRWQPAKGWLVEPGLRFDWDEIVRRPLLSPRLAAVYSPPGDKDTTKISAGIGLYYEHTQLEYLAQTFAGRPLRHVLRSRWSDANGPGRSRRNSRRTDSTAARAARVELERRRGAQAAVVDLCRRELP